MSLLGHGHAVGIDSDVAAAAMVATIHSSHWSHHSKMGFACHSTAQKGNLDTWILHLESWCLIMSYHLIVCIVSDASTCSTDGK